MNIIKTVRRLRARALLPTVSLQIIRDVINTIMSPQLQVMGHQARMLMKQ